MTTRVVETAGYYRVEYKWKPWFGKERWSPCWLYYEGPLAVFADKAAAIEFAKNAEGQSGEALTVVWP